MRILSEGSASESRLAVRQLAVPPPAKMMSNSLLDDITRHRGIRYLLREVGQTALYEAAYHGVRPELSGQDELDARR